MPWKIVNLDYDCDEPHLHMRDGQLPIHMVVYFGAAQVLEVSLGGEEVDTCHLRAQVTPSEVNVKATRFCAQDLSILDSILASLDVEESTRREALRWTNGSVPDDDGWYPGNVKALLKSAVSAWPRDLTDEALLDALHDPGAIPLVRRRALEAEAKSRGFRAYM